MPLQNASIKVTEFIIGGFDKTEKPFVVGVVILITYVLAILANMMNILFIIYDKRLHKPMYLLICNLAVVDILYTSSASPTMIGVLVAGVKTISYVPCFIEMMGVVLTLEARHGLMIGAILGPSLVNPFVYCLRTKEIRCKIFRIFKNS
ncbi:olfactory receptor 13G1-like [Thunnus thynnus]|uniref:olfactory receptor 13G1-like n=1 Tax=Thunnus thynnus TaxID=8237 RepID=UPI0035289D8C